MGFRTLLKNHDDNNSDHKNDLFSTYCVPGTVLSNLFLLTHVILMTTIWQQVLSVSAILQRLSGLVEIPSGNCGAGTGWELSS